MGQATTPCCGSKARLPTKGTSERGTGGSPGEGWEVHSPLTPPHRGGLG